MTPADAPEPTDTEIAAADAYDPDVVPDFRMEVFGGRGHLDVLFDSRFNSMVMNFLSGSR